MDLKTIKELAVQYTVEELDRFANELESSGSCPIKTKEDLGELMSDLLQAREVRAILDQGKSLPEAMREFSKRVREILS